MKRGALLIAAVVGMVGAFFFIDRKKEQPRPIAEAPTRPIPSTRPSTETRRAIAAALRPQGQELPSLPPRALPTSLADVPKTPAFHAALFYVKMSGAYPPDLVEPLFDYKLKFLARLRGCDRNLPTSGSVTWHVFFQPGMAPDGTIPRVGTASRVTLDRRVGVDDEAMAELDRCVGPAVYGLPLEMPLKSKDPEFHMFLNATFPLDETSEPYRLLLNGPTPEEVARWHR